MENSLKVTVIVPCFNEEMFVASTISSLLLCPTVSEIIVVNDGSKDNTLKIAQLFKEKLKIVSYPKNHGKGFAMSEGIKKATSDIIVFCDGHVINLEDRHIKTLITPLLKNQADAVLGQAGRSIPDLPDPFGRITGFRAYFKKDLLPETENLKNTKFGAEIYLNHIMKEKRVKLIKIKGLIHILKQAKMPTGKMIRSYINEFSEIAVIMAGVNGFDQKTVEKILDPRKIKSIKSLRLAVRKIKNKGILEPLKEYIYQYLTVS